jgi:D-sedoheptulose 7-phosphate isomerase
MSSQFHSFAADYQQRLKAAIDQLPPEGLEDLAQSLMKCWREGKQVFIFGNGGSAGNAIHLANDFLYGISRQLGHALKVHALPANSAVITCLANDEGYDGIFFRQLAVLAQPGDIAIALSGSGNSPNIVQALKWCKENQVKSFAILGFEGGASKDLADTPIHVHVKDMQISEDLQLIVGHMMMQWLYQHHADIPRRQKS